MKKSNQLQRSDLCWGLAFLAILILQFWWLPGEKGTATDSWSNSVDGKLGLYQVLTSLYPDVRRDPMKLCPEAPTSLLMIAPDRYPSETEKLELYEFVAAGGALLVAPHWGDPELEITSLGIKVTGTGNGGTGNGGTGNGGTGSPAQAPVTNHDEVTNADAVTVTSPLVSGAIPWRTQGQVELTGWLDTETLVSSGETVHVATWQVGDGRVILCSSPDVFSNRSMLFPDSRRLAVRLVEKLRMHHRELTGEDGPLVISEYLNSGETYQEAKVLLSPALRSGTLQLIALALLGFWYGFHRFGPATSVSSAERRSLSDSAMAVGSLQFRLHDGGPVVHQYLEYVRAYLGRRFGSSVRFEKPDVLAQRADLELPHVRAALKNLSAVARAGKVSSAQAAASIRWLAMLQSRLAGNRDVGHSQIIAESSVIEPFPLSDRDSFSTDQNASSASPSRRKVRSPVTKRVAGAGKSLGQERRRGSRMDVDRASDNPIAVRNPKKLPPRPRKSDDGMDNGPKRSESQKDTRGRHADKLRDDAGSQ